MQKTCTKCRKLKPLDDFNKQATGTFQRQTWCKACFDDYRKAWLLSRPDKVAKYRENARVRMKAKYANDPKQREYIRQNKRAWLSKKTPTDLKTFRWRQWIWSKYRLREEDHDRMVKDQKGRCAVCRKKVKTWVIDHCHDSGKVRGLVCRKCNNGLGAFNDNPDELRRAVAYLEGCQAKFQAVS